MGRVGEPGGDVHVFMLLTPNSCEMKQKGIFPLFAGVGNTGGALLGKALPAAHPMGKQDAAPLHFHLFPLCTGVVCVYLAGYLMETTGSWISVFNLVAAVNSVGLCAFLVFGEAQRVDTDSAYIDM